MEVRLGVVLGGILSLTTEKLSLLFKAAELHFRNGIKQKTDFLQEVVSSLRTIFVCPLKGL